jgi:hypothetical protein
MSFESFSNLITYYVLQLQTNFINEKNVKNKKVIHLN